MSTGLPVVGSATPPVQEVVRHGETRLLVDFFSPSLSEAVNNPVLIELWQQSSANKLGSLYSTGSACSIVCHELSLIQLVASGGLG